jgi:hypothetical protein
MGKTFKGLVLASSSLILVLFYNLLMVGAAATALMILKHWVLPVYLLWLVFGTVVGLLFGSILCGPPGTHRLLTFNPSRFERPFWKWVRRFGIIPLAVLATWIGSSVAAALMIRSLGLTGRRAWVTALTADLIVAFLTALIYLGCHRLSR